MYPIRRPNVLTQLYYTTLCVSCVGLYGLIRLSLMLVGDNLWLLRLSIVCAVLFELVMAGVSQLGFTLYACGMPWPPVEFGTISSLSIIIDHLYTVCRPQISVRAVVRDSNQYLVPFVTFTCLVWYGLLPPLAFRTCVFWNLLLSAATYRYLFR